MISSAQVMRIRLDSRGTDASGKPLNLFTKSSFFSTMLNEPHQAIPLFVRVGRALPIAIPREPVGMGLPFHGAVRVSSDLSVRPPIDC